jgi:hypothetical protein
VKENGIKQEFFAALTCTNIFMQFTALSDTIIKIKKYHKYEYKTNIRKAVAILRAHLYILLREKSLMKLIGKLIDCISEFKSAIRPDRFFHGISMIVGTPSTTEKYGGIVGC